MNTARIKLLSWTLAGFLGLALSLYVAWFVSQLERIEQRVTPERMKKVLENVPEIVQKADDIVPYETVSTAMIELDWTGKPRVKAVAAQREPEPQQPPAEDIEELLKVAWIAYDAEQPDASRCVLKYTPKARVSTPQSATGRVPGWIKTVGDALDDGNSHIKVFAIRPDGVEFAFDDETREHQFVGPTEVRLEGFVVLGDESELQLRRESILVPRLRSSREPVAKTRQVYRDTWQIGYEDAQYINENYSQILSQDVRYTRHRDPNTGRYDGIQILDVKPGSVAATHGVETGDVVKSINGHPVTSSQEAISFVKNNKDLYQKWDVVVLSKGQLKTMTYYSPKE